MAVIRHHIARMLEYISLAWAWVVPPRGWKAPVYMVCGIFAGLGLHVINISNATSYVFDKPEACMNCHVMSTEFATWEKGNHGHVTECIDCHLPHGNPARALVVKGEDGFWHSFVFTFRLDPQVIRIRKPSRNVAHRNCVRCHERAVSRLDLVSAGECWRCHREVPHGRIRSQGATPFARVPRLSRPVPDWILQMAGI